MHSSYLQCHHLRGTHDHPHISEVIADTHAYTAINTCAKQVLYKNNFVIAINYPIAIKIGIMQEVVITIQLYSTLQNLKFLHYFELNL